MNDITQEDMDTCPGYEHEMDVDYYKVFEECLKSKGATFLYKRGYLASFTHLTEDILKQAIKQAGWVPQMPAISDEHGLIAGEQSLETFGDNESAGYYIQHEKYPEYQVWITEDLIQYHAI